MDLPPWSLNVRAKVSLLDAMRLQWFENNVSLPETDLALCKYSLWYRGIQPPAALLVLRSYFFRPPSWRRNCS
ncbi:hypothetical protein AWB78_08113 [Caballeronia calidae]|uniref:Uncharacterized protein n=1 Tax=Caballeronia calidae TaxID=1777139 RepID=A0A158EHZ3_9BURK|nr:hypothetical protein AWB78_08113 [Caballeronia calidae]